MARNSCKERTASLKARSPSLSKTLISVGAAAAARSKLLWLSVSGNGDHLVDILLKWITQMKRPFPENTKTWNFIMIPMKLNGSWEFPEFRGTGSGRVGYRALCKYRTLEFTFLSTFHLMYHRPHPSNVHLASVENNHQNLKEQETLKMVSNINICPQIGSPGSW